MLTPTICSVAGRGGGASRQCLHSEPRTPRRTLGSWRACRPGDLADLVQQLTDQMHTAAADLQFELAARLRDEISDLKKELRQMVEANR